MPEYEKCRVCQKEFLKYDQRGFRNAGFTAHQNKCVEKNRLLTTSNRVPDDKNKRNQRLLLPASRSSDLLYSPYSPKHRHKKPSSFVSAEKQKLHSPIDFNSSSSSSSSLFQIQHDSTSSMSQSLLENRIFPVMQCDYCTPNFGSHQPNCWFLTNMINQQRQ